MVGDVDYNGAIVTKVDCIEEVEKATSYHAALIG
jgi:hypothetical protein